MRTRLRGTLALAAILGVVGSLALAGTVLAAETTLTATLAGVTEGENPGGGVSMRCRTSAAWRHTSSAPRAPRQLLASGFELLTSTRPQKS